MPATENTSSPRTRLLNSVIDHHAANFWLQRVNPLWSVNQALGKIVNKTQTAQDMVSLKIKTNRHFDRGVAGQHHPVVIECDGRRYERTYSLTQLDQQHVLLTVKKVAQGKVSQWLVNQAQVDDVIEFGQPYGDMCLTDAQENLVLLAAGSGITPMYSLIETWVKQNHIENKKIQLLYWVKQHADLAFKERFQQLSETHENFSYQIFYTQEIQADERLNPKHLALIDQTRPSSIYVCGPSGFVSTAQSLFAEMPHFKSEAFSLSPITDGDVGFINVTLSKSAKTVQIPKGQSILLGLEQQSIRPTYGCRMGICNKCACHKSQGATKNLVNGGENTEPGNSLKLCVNSAQTDLVIDL